MTKFGNVRMSLSDFSEFEGSQINRQKFSKPKRNNNEDRSKNYSKQYKRGNQCY